MPRMQDRRPGSERFNSSVVAKCGPLATRSIRAGGEFVVVHSTDAGRTWREVPQRQQYPDPDARLAFSFLDATRGWIAWWNATADEPKMIGTRDGGQHWQSVSQQFLQRIQMVDDSRGYGTLAQEFFRTNDGGRSWVETKIPDIGFIDHLFFLTPELGWISGAAGVSGKDFFVFRTVNGGTRLGRIPNYPSTDNRLRYAISSSSINSAAGSSPGITVTTTVPICIPRLTEESIGCRTLIHRSKGRASRQASFDLPPEKEALSFFLKAGKTGLCITMDGGTHWYKQASAEIRL